MTRFALAVALLLLQEKTVDNPTYALWKDCKPGTWTKFKSVTESGSSKIETFTTYKLKELTAEKAVVTCLLKVGNTETPSEEVIPATMKVAGGMPAETPKDTKIEKKGEGDEELEIAGKKVKCHWIENVADMNGVKSATKIWMSRDVPGGLVKQVSISKGPAESISTLSLQDFKKE